MAGETATAPPTAESIGLQAQLDQLEAAILEAHRHIDRSASRDADKDADINAPGAEATATRCIEEMQDLNSRLDSLVGRVGTL